MQLCTVVVPTLEALKKEGEAGRRKITQYTRYATLGLAFFQALGISIALEAQPGLVVAPGLSFRLITAVTLVTGTMFLMWLGEQITERGLGNGISLLIFAGIAAGLPNAIGLTLEQARTGAYSIPLVLGIAVLVVDRDRIRRVRRARAAQDPGQLREAPGRQQGLPGPELAPAAEAQHGGRHSADLRLVDHPVPGHARAVVRQRRRHDLAARPRVGARPRPAGARDPVRVGDHLLLLLLHGAAVQPEGDGREPEEERRVHPGLPPRRPDGAATSRRSRCASRCWARCTSSSSASCRIS